MVLSVELLKRLNANEEPLPKRLKLAENVFHAVEVPIIHKEDIILQWLCEISNGNQKAWSLLRSCLNTKYLDIKIDVKKLLINTFIETLQKDVKHIHSDVFKCCDLIISNKGIQQYFNNKLDDLGFLLKSLLECIDNVLKCNFNVEKLSVEERNIEFINKSDELTLTAYNTVINIIEIIIQMFKTTFTIKDNLRTIFIRNVLYPVCSIIDHKFTDNTNRLSAVTYTCIQELIFGKKHIHSKEFIKEKHITQFENVLSILTEEAKTKDPQCNLVTFTFVFRAAINIFKSDSIMLDLILRGLIKCVGTCEKEIFNSFLKNLNDITFNFDNKIHDITLFDYCQNIVDNMLLSKKMSRIDYDLLTQFCHFNPLLIEKNMQDILKKVFMGKSVPERTKLITSIMDVCIHLRQEEKIVSTMLIALNDCLNKISNTEIDILFLNEIKEKFMKSVNNITSTQIINILRTLVYHLKTNCMQVLQSDDTCTGKNIVILQATVELLTTFLDGTCVFEHTGTIVFHKKFINDFTELRNILSLLIAQMLQLSYNEKITATLLAAIFSWNEMLRTLKYYVPKIVPQDLKFPISEDQWQQLIQRITNFGTDNSKNCMNKLILQQAKISQNTLSESSVILNNLIGGFEYSWQYILKFDTQIIPFLNNEQISKIAQLLLIQMTCDANSFSKWIEILHKDSLQENRRLILSISNCVFVRIGRLITEGVTKSISEYFHTDFLLETDANENGKLNDILVYMKEELLKEEWIQIDDKSLTKIKRHLEVLLDLPLMFLNPEIRTAMFMYIFALRMECNYNDEVISLCYTIFSDLLEKSDVNIFEYINPSLLLSQLPHNKITQRSVELFLRNCSSYTILKNVVKSSMNSKKNILLLLNSMERVKAKLNADQKIIIKKAEKKISKGIIKMAPSKITEIDDMKILNLMLKINITNENIDEKLKTLAQSTLDDIFMNVSNNKITNEMLQDGLQLATIIIHNPKIFQITNDALKGIWFVSFKYPRADVILPLLESSEAKEFQELLEHLHNQVIKALLNAQENDIENICIIWNSILKTNMSINRSKLRLSAISRLIQTIQNIIIPENLRSKLLKLIQNILSAKHLYLPGYVIDMCISVGLKALQDATISLCSDILELCNVLLKMRTSLITDRLPALLLLYRQILNIVVHKSKTIVDKSEEYVFKGVALDVEKFINFLTKLKKELVLISPYLVADLLELFSEDSIASFVKISLQNCINHLIGICDHHGIALLSRTLPISMQEMFKVQLNVYNQFYKFSGKI